MKATLDAAAVQIGRAVDTVMPEDCELPRIVVFFDTAVPPEKGLLLVVPDDLIRNVRMHGNEVLALIPSSGIVLQPERGLSGRELSLLQGFKRLLAAVLLPEETVCNLPPC